MSKAIEVNNLVKYYRIHRKEEGLRGSVKALFSRKHEDVKAVDGISFQIEEGELVGFIGPNGAGKTTTLKCLSGILYPTSGEIAVLGFMPNERKDEFLSQIGLVMGQKNQLWWDLPAQETFRLNKEIYGLSDEEYEKSTNELIELLEARDLLKIQVRKLSLGQRMKCELIAALLHRPKVLFLDEPTIGLDVVMQKKMRDFIREYNRQHKATILLTSHYMGDVKELCERVILIDKGRIGFDGPLGQITERYINHKRISMTLSVKISSQEISSYGKVMEFDFPRVVIEVPKEKVPEVVGRILNSYAITDLTVEEEPIEEIIRKVFSNSPPD